MWQPIYTTEQDLGVQRTSHILYLSKKPEIFNDIISRTGSHPLRFHISLRSFDRELVEEVRKLLSMTLDLSERWHDVSLTFDFKLYANLQALEHRLPVLERLLLRGRSSIVDTASLATQSGWFKDAPACATYPFAACGTLTLYLGWSTQTDFPQSKTDHVVTSTKSRVPERGYPAIPRTPSIGKTPNFCCQGWMGIKVLDYTSFSQFGYEEIDKAIPLLESTTSLLLASGTWSSAAEFVDSIHWLEGPPLFSKLRVLELDNRMLDNPIDKTLDLVLPLWKQ
ncbi:hypothetical protein C8J56DRAFT_895055 [Mycena floridula]|nr:hypothetical protein C8J56DRAFT_895055 [Mycena floridula]